MIMANESHGVSRQQRNGVENSIVIMAGNINDSILMTWRNGVAWRNVRSVMAKMIMASA